MMRTNKKGGNCFKKASPHKGLFGAIGMGVNKLLGKDGGTGGGTGGGNASAVAALADAQGGGNAGGGGAIFGGMNPNKATIGPNLPSGLAKKEGYTPYKSISPLKGADRTLVMGARAAADDYGYNTVVPNALGNISVIAGETTASSANVVAHKKKRSRKKGIKNDMKMAKFTERKNRGFIDNWRYA